MSQAFAINSHHIRNFNLSVMVAPAIYGLLQRAGVPLLSPGKRQQGRVVAVPRIQALGLTGLDEVVDYQVQSNGQVRALVKRVDAVLYPDAAYDDQGAHGCCRRCVGTCRNMQMLY